MPVELPPKELAHRLTMAGTEVGGLQEIGGSWDRERVVVGRVLEVNGHPRADRLTLPTVELGDGETATVVCGAPNVAAGQMIAFAKEGALLFNPRSGKAEPLRAATIRGVESRGMVCSALELGLGDDHEGILVLDPDAPLGAPLIDHLGDTVLDIEVTPNRPDCMSVLGVAREAAALTGQEATEPDLSYEELGPPIGGQVTIEIADPQLCSRYTASLISDITIGESPQWMQDALVKAGQRPINNVVDVTNYVMLEYGQPLHAFDFDTVKDNTIIVRAARPGEVITTLDGERRTLDPPVLTIADASDAVGLAGVIGGASSEMHEGTKTVLLESASFDPINTRRTSASLRLSTEASYRFERGIRAELAPLALRRATQLILRLADGRAARGVVDLYPGREETPTVTLSQRRIEQVLGARFEMDRVAGVLASLGFQEVNRCATPGAEAVSVKAPYWRSDISIEDDLVEEIARIEGYDSLPVTMLSGPIPHAEPQPMAALKEQLRDTLAAGGMRETITYSATSLATLEKVDALDGGPEPIRLANPMSGDLEYLKTSLRGSILETLASNRRISQSGPMRLFEIGRVYLQKEEAKERELPEEREMLVGVLSGRRFPVSWQAPEGDLGFFDAKGMLEEMFAVVGVSVAYEAGADSVLHPGRTARMTCGGTPVGVVGEVHPKVLESFDLGSELVALFEVDLRLLANLATQADRRYESASRFPESHRDLALIVGADVSSDDVKALIEANRLVTSATPFDVYSGEGVPAGKKSIAYRVVYQSKSSTLTSQQVDGAQRDIVRRLRRRLGAELRTRPDEKESGRSGAW